MNFKTTFALILLLAALAALAFHLSSDSKKESETTSSVTDAPKAAAKSLVDIKADDVDSLTIKPSDADEIDLKKSGNDWRMTKPVNARANSGAISEFLSNLLALKSTGQVELDQASGLNPPKVAITLTPKSGPAINVNIGDRTPLRDVMYVQVVGSSTVDVTSAGTYEQFFKSANDLRDTSLVHVPSDQVNEVVVQKAAGPKIVLQKSDGKWRETAPQTFAADTGVMDSFLSSVTGLNASSFLKPRASTLGAHLDEPQVTVAFRVAPAATQPTAAAPVLGPPVPGAAPTGPQTTIRIGQYDNARKENMYASVSDTGEVVKVAASTLEQFAKSPIDFRDRTVAAISPDSVERFTVRVDRKATTQPTTMPADLHGYVIARRVQTPTPPATQPTSSIGSTHGEVASRQLDHCDGSSVAWASRASRPCLRSRMKGPYTVNTQCQTEDMGETPMPRNFRPADLAFAYADEPAPTPATQPAAPATQPSPPDTQPTTAATTTPAAEVPPSVPTTQPSVADTRPPTATTLPAIGETHPSTAIAPAAIPATQPAIATTEPAIAATQPAVASAPVTAPTTLPAVATTQPVVPAMQPASKWYFLSGTTGDAEEGQVNALLESFTSLHVVKYIDPGTFTGNTYTVILHTIPHKAGDAPADETFTFIDAGNRVIGQYQGLTFEVDRSILDKITGDFKTKKPAPPAPSPTPGMGGFGGPGGMPMAQ